MKSVLLFIISISLYIQSSEMERFDIDHENENRHFLIYVPKSDKKIDKIVIGLHGYTGSASGFEMETTGGFNNSADKYNFIAVYPQGSFFYENSYSRGQITSNYISSWNDLTGSKTKTPIGETCAIDAVMYPKYPNCEGTDAGRCAWTSCGDDIGFIKTVIDKVKKKFNIEDIYIVGMSNGGKMAHALGCVYGNEIRGIINVVGSPQYGLACKPQNPVNYIIYAGNNDYVVPPFDIVSHDKYFYTPITNITQEWSETFACKNKQSIKHEKKDLIHEEIFSDCSNSVSVISLVNMNGGHSWPGTKESAGFCKTDAQKEIDLESCNYVDNEWGNDFLLEKLFKL
tara:strand:+ start:100 stop:1125 length:1026 start_codon:yes stop_codon:yes gene_type:complete